MALNKAKAGPVASLRALLKRFIHAERMAIPDRIFAITVIFQFFFGLFLFLVDQLLLFSLVSWLAGSLSVSAAVAVVLVRARRPLPAKLLVHAHAAIVIFLISMVFSLGSFILFFILPVFVSLVVVFDRHERPYALLMGAVFLLVASWIVLEDPRLMPIDMTAEETRIIRIINVLGSLGFTLFQVGYAVRVNDVFQHELLELNRSASVYNTMLETNVTERNRLIQMMSHDLRSPFGNLVVSLDDAVLEEVGEEERLAMIRRIRMDALSTLHMLDSIRLWVRSRQGSLKLDIHANPVRPVLEQVRQLMADDAVRKGVDLRFALDREFAVQADRFALASVLRNLVSNAIKFTPQGGEVTVGVADEKGLLRFTVTDTGKGMTEDEVRNVRARTSFSSRGTAQEKGHGVGLLIVQEFLDRHDSQLELDSRPDRGTSFAFLLPAA